MDQPPYALQARLLAEHLSRLDRSAAWVAARAGLHPGTFARYLSGERAIPVTGDGLPSPLVRIALGLALTPAETAELARAAGVDWVAP